MSADDRPRSAACSPPLLTTVCVQLVLEYKVNADRSVEATYRIGLQSSLYALAASGGQDPLSELRESTVAEGFSLSQYRERDHSGIVARRLFADLAELELSVPRYGRTALILATAFSVGAVVALGLATLSVLLRRRRAL